MKHTEEVTVPRDRLTTDWIMTGLHYFTWEKMVWSRPYCEGRKAFLFRPECTEYGLLRSQRLSQTSEDIKREQWTIREMLASLLINNKSYQRKETYYRQHQKASLKPHWGKRLHQGYSRLHQAQTVKKRLWTEGHFWGASPEQIPNLAEGTHRPFISVLQWSVHCQIVSDNKHLYVPSP